MFLFPSQEPNTDTDTGNLKESEFLLFKVNFRNRWSLDPFRIEYKSGSTVGKEFNRLNELLTQNKDGSWVKRPCKEERMKRKSVKKQE